jgi:hypothetical protein
MNEGVAIATTTTVAKVTLVHVERSPFISLATQVHGSVQPDVRHKHFSSSLSAVHKASSPMGTGGSFLGGKASRGVKLTTYI